MWRRLRFDQIMSFFGLFFVLLGQSALSKGAVCFLAMWQVLLNSCGGLAVAQLKEGGTELRSYAGGHIQTHACTQILACTHTAAVMMCRPEVLEIKKKIRKRNHWRASGGGHIFRLMSSYFSDVTAKICSSICLCARVCFCSFIGYVRVRQYCVRVFL